MAMLNQIARATAKAHQSWAEKTTKFLCRNIPENHKEDSYQEGMLAFFELCLNYDGPFGVESFRATAFNLIRRGIVGHFRSQIRAFRVEHTNMNEVGKILCQNDHQKANTIIEAVNSLRGPEKRAIELKMMGESVANIARIEGRSPRTIRLYLKCGRDKIADIIKLGSPCRRQLQIPAPNPPLTNSPKL